MSEKEYIERGALIDDLERELSGTAGYARRDAIIKLVKKLNAIPAADVEPVVRGEWMWKTTKEAEAFAPLGIVLGTENYICSECKKYLHRESMRNPLPKYCDECGAKMGLPGKERER